MNYYEFEDKASDQKFLNHLPVSCQVTISKNDWLTGMIEEGDSLVIVLTSKKKYKGKIMQLNWKEIDGYLVGEMLVSRGG